MDPVIELKALSVWADGRRLLEAVDLVLHEGVFLGVIGPSGSGKSTLLRVLVGLDRPTSGAISYRGAPGPPPPGTMRFVPHDRPRIGRLDDVVVSLEGSTIPLGRRRRGREDVELLVVDEPFARADPRHRTAIREHLARLRRDRPELVVVVSSNVQDDLLEIADQVAMLDRGRLSQIGPPDELLAAPASVRVARFVGTPPMNLFPAAVVERGGRWALAIGTDVLDPGDRPSPGPPGTPLLVGVRPGHLHRAAPSIPFDRVLHVTAGEVDVVDDIVHFGLGSVSSSAYAAARVGARTTVPGDRLELSWVVDRMHLFDAASGRPVP